MQNTFILFIIINHTAQKCSCQFQEGCASTNGKKMGELSASTTEVPCMYASREDKERKWRRLIMKKNEFKHLNTGHSCWEKPIKAGISLNHMA